jgi:hypothetical protein
MRLWLTLFVLLWQVAPTFAQIRKNTFDVTPDGQDGLILAVGSYLPLRDALDYLNREYGWRISYEDPVYPDSELSDIAVPEWKKNHPGARCCYFPKFSEMRFRISKPTGSKGEREKIVGELVEQFNMSGRIEKAKLIEATLEQFS